MKDEQRYGGGDGIEGSDEGCAGDHAEQPRGALANGSFLETIFVCLNERGRRVFFERAWKRFAGPRVLIARRHVWIQAADPRCLRTVNRTRLDRPPPQVFLTSVNSKGRLKSFVLIHFEKCSILKGRHVKPYYSFSISPSSFGGCEEFLVAGKEKTAWTPEAGTSFYRRYDNRRIGYHPSRNLQYKYAECGFQKSQKKRTSRSRSYVPLNRRSLPSDGKFPDWTFLNLR